MKSHGLLFKDEMCRAIGRAVDPKWQTRRLVARHNSTVDGSRWSKEAWARLDFSKARSVSYGSLIVPTLADDDLHEVTAVYQLGDHIWVKQVWADVSRATGDSCAVAYREDAPNHRAPHIDGALLDLRIEKWKSSLLMPKWAARYHLEITEPVRAERASDISEEDAKAEGVTPWQMSETWLCVTKDGRTFDVFVEPDAEMIAEDEIELVKHRPSEQMGTARDAFERLWNEISGAEMFQSWVWRIPFKRLAQATVTPATSDRGEG